jgi:hypothetical protein
MVKDIRLATRRLAGRTACAAITDEVKDLHREALARRTALPSCCWKAAFSKKHDRGWGQPRMRYHEIEKQIEKLEIICLVKQSHLPTRQTRTGRVNSDADGGAMTATGSGSRRCVRISIGFVEMIPEHY